ncbi:MAG: L-glutamate gamma-semialdehyde dehydrogenase [Planctomycetota bacterium]|nr:MAG: L-glutamate gamma-semialdehyde dehydrogenase [Planctomycetota bacterium]
MGKRKAGLQRTVERQTQRLGRRIWESIAQRQASIFERRWWDERILRWAMSDESVKVQMFRFVDVLPMLRTPESVVRHLQEYFEDVRRFLPGAARIAIDLSAHNTVLARALAINARATARRMASRFIAGRTVEDVLQAVAKLRRRGFAFTLDLLGEAVISDVEADAYQQAYLELIRGLTPAVDQWSEDAILDRDSRGPIPRVNVSLKLSALDSHFRPIAPRYTAEQVKARLRPILRLAREVHAYVHVDMEQYAYKDLTLQIFQEVLSEDEFRDFENVGIVVQAYLREAARDLEGLLAWVKRRGTPIWLRLVKGAYWDYETIVAQYRGWPIPVFQQKWMSDAQFEQLTAVLMQNHRWLRPAIASHNVRSLAHALAWAEAEDVAPGDFEIQMLYGMGGEIAEVIRSLGHRVRIYTPFGELIPGMAYLVRRLLENTSNDSFLRQSFTEHFSIDRLLEDPKQRGPLMLTAPVPQPAPGEFRNEPHADFSREENRRALQAAIDEVREQLGRDYALHINGRAVDSRAEIVSRNPSHKQQVVGRVCAATAKHAAEAIAAARAAFDKWAATDPAHRAEYLELVADQLRKRRFELAAWEIFEVGKPWAEADADITEAIDFCMYYAQQMRRLARGRRCDVPGEENEYLYRPRGVCVVIAPWNFPLAILTGMTVAALVTGNTVVMKPAEQSPVIAAKLMEIFDEVGIPAGVVNYLPGVGEEVGPPLVQSRDIDMIAFTGSRAVGLQINRQAAEVEHLGRSVKRVIAEMGGKNAIIIDDDADLDEAVMGVVKSAFGYSGQKCSACSRAIVLEPVYDAFVERLIEAARSLPVGPAEDPVTEVGPVIDEEALRKIESYIELGTEEFACGLAVDVGDLAEEGYYVGPHVFLDVDPSSRLAQEEIFGPVLAVIRARDLDHALTIANDTDYALTGGLYSRSPGNIAKVRRRFEVGNLYINRPITGALVERQPFGGFKLSGIGSKAGGPDYLQQFLIPVNITENTMRRGFAPPPHAEHDQDAVSEAGSAEAADAPAGAETTNGKADE